MQSVVGLPLRKDVSLSTDAVARSKRSQRTIKISASPIKPRRVDYTFLRCSDVSPAMRTYGSKRKWAHIIRSMFSFHMGRVFLLERNVPFSPSPPCNSAWLACITVVDPQFKLLLQVHHSNIEMKAPQVLALDGGMEIHTCTAAHMWVAELTSIQEIVYYYSMIMHVRTLNFTAD